MDAHGTKASTASAHGYNTRIDSALCPSTPLFKRCDSLSPRLAYRHEKPTEMNHTNGMLNAPGESEVDPISWTA